MIDPLLIEALELNLDATILAHGLGHLSRREALIELDRLPAELEDWDEWDENWAMIPSELNEWKKRIPKRMWIHCRPTPESIFGLGGHYDDFREPPATLLLMHFVWSTELSDIYFGPSYDGSMPVHQIDDVLAYLVLRAELLNRCVLTGGHREEMLFSQHYEFTTLDPSSSDPLAEAYWLAQRSALPRDHRSIAAHPLMQRATANRPAPQEPDLFRRKRLLK
jgi:hypothetical protein